VSDEYWHSYGFVKASYLRMNVLNALSYGPVTPGAISSVVRKPPSHVSNALRELVEEGLVVCRTPELRKGRLYELTELGRRILASID